jgi:hypothetical protein
VLVQPTGHWSFTDWLASGVFLVAFVGSGIAASARDPIWLCGLAVATIAYLGSGWILYPYLTRYGVVESTTRCRVCGYDLRATPERCPECGPAAEKANKTEAERSVPDRAADRC